MRVITGIAKGHKLKTLAGEQTRPTSDRVKEAMFSVIQPYIAESVVLDLFAGSGSLGIEALSRSANHCDFVEKSKPAVRIIAENLQKTHLYNYEIFNLSAKDYLYNCSKAYDIVFLDPPYNKKLCDEALILMINGGLLKSGAVVVCETGAKENIGSSLHIIKQSVYGATKLTFYENR